MSRPVAIVTGGASGIGLAVSKHLLSRNYSVVVADYNVEAGQEVASELGPACMFQKTDVSDYKQQSALFRRAFEWGGGRLDFFAANAGIDDKQSLYTTDDVLDEDGSPLPLNLKTVDVNFTAIIQGIWLFKFYTRKNKAPGGKVVITSSAAGLYPMDTQPQYTTAKHALVGLTRSAGPVFAREGITVNCICPAFVATNLCPSEVMAIFPEEHITPMSTVIKAFDRFLDDDSMTGQTVELSLDSLYFRTQPDYPNESQRWLRESSKEIWSKSPAYALPSA